MRKLGKPTDQRMAMLRNMVTVLIDNGRMETTYMRAKEVSSLADKMIALGKENNLANKRRAMSFMTSEDVVRKLFDEVSPKYADRNGGFTRITKLGPRRGDAAEAAVIELV
ncbi:MAG: 50S ribosomal protein L17 [Oscillospiraceae bacterium]|nr:50S ribosomal protein L17 [Oscillospiraceae bacterium]